jgi:hypothetical protein
MIPSEPAESPNTRPRRTWIILTAVFALGFVHFWIRSTPVRLANTDDAVHQRLTDENGVAQWTIDNARSQGRFYFATPLVAGSLNVLYEIRNPWLFSLLRTMALFLQIGLAGWLLARVAHSPAWGAALSLFIMGTLHVPQTFYPILSFPGHWIGFCAVLAALHLHYTYLHRPGLLTGIATGALLLQGCLMGEIFVLFLPLFLSLSLLQPNPNWRHRLQANLAPLVTATGYVAVYLLFSRQFPSTYDGTRFSADLSLAGQVVLRQMIGIAPGFELLVRRQPAETGGPLFRELSEIVQTVTLIPWQDLLLALVEAFSLTGLLLHCSRHLPPLIHRWPWALCFAAFLNLPIAFSVKYQVFILHREFPYVYAFYSFFFLSLTVIAGASFGIRRLSRTGHRMLSAGLLGLLITTLCLSAMASNHRVLQILMQKFN